jgi:hypothetical protein
MKALAWYTIIFNILVIIAFILNLTGVIAKPPFTALEGIAWAVLTVPVVILGIMVIMRIE